MDDDLDLGEEEKGKDIPFIRLENVHKTYLLGVEGIAALRGVDLEVKEGEFVMICGTSGGGKSTMLNIMGTIDKPTKGRVTLCSKLITPRTTDDELANIRLENLGFVFQTFNLLSSMTALENVELPLTFLGYNSKKRKQIATKLLQTVQMGDRLNHYPSMLSGGEQQRVTIARAMANKPGLLLLDEPTGDLDTLNTNNVIRMLINLNMKGTTLVMVTHDMNLVPYGTRVVYMRDGKIWGSRMFAAEDRAAKIAELDEQISMGRDGNRSYDALGRRENDVVNTTTSSTSASHSSPSAIFPTNFPSPSSPSSSSSSTSSDPTPTSPSSSAAVSSSSFPPSDPTSSSAAVSAEAGVPGVGPIIIPQCTSVREPGDYDPVAMADPGLKIKTGYEVGVVNYPAVEEIRPYTENPYSNLRKEVVGGAKKVVGKKNLLGSGKSSSSSSSSTPPSSRPSSKGSSKGSKRSSKDSQNPDGSPDPTVFLAGASQPSRYLSPSAATTPMSLSATPDHSTNNGDDNGLNPSTSLSAVADYGAPATPNATLVGSRSGSGPRSQSTASSSSSVETVAGEGTGTDLTWRPVATVPVD